MDQGIEAIGQPASAFPELLDDEKIILETGQGIPVLVLVAAAIFMLTPPFVLGPLVLILIGYLWWRLKDGRLVLTNLRLLIFQKKATGGYVLDSIPLNRIKLASTIGATMKDPRYLFVENKTIEIYIEGNLLPKAKCPFVKNAKHLIRELEIQKSAANNSRVQL